MSTSRIRFSIENLLPSFCLAKMHVARCRDTRSAQFTFDFIVKLSTSDRDAHSTLSIFAGSCLVVENEMTHDDEFQESKLLDNLEYISFLKHLTL